MKSALDVGRIVGVLILARRTPTPANGTRTVLRRLAFGLLFAVAGFIVAAVASYFLIGVFSSNMHDRSVEASMTSIFFFGPVGGLLGFVAGAIVGRRPPPKTRDGG